MSSPILSTGPTGLPPANRQARLRGPSVRLDPRCHPVRADLAGLHLAELVVAPRYSTGVAMHCNAAETPMIGTPSIDAIVVSFLLHGETFTVFDTHGGWAWGQSATDGYVGWVAEAALNIGAQAASHRITAPDALLFSSPSIKSAVVARLPLNAGIVAENFDDSFIFLPTEQAWLHRRHVAALTGDAVDLAHGFLGTPYRWGGRSRAGIDCSGFTQAVLIAHGVACPRDSDQQLAAFEPVDPLFPQRGDLAFFPGHVGMMIDAEHILHANAYWMTTLVEPLADVMDRLRNSHTEPLTGIARPPLSEGGALSIGPLGEPARRSQCATAASA